MRAIREGTWSGSDFGWDEILGRSGGRSGWTNWLTPLDRLSEPALKRLSGLAPDNLRKGGIKNHPAKSGVAAETTDALKHRLFFVPAEVCRLPEWFGAIMKPSLRQPQTAEQRSYRTG